jgi:hypothetical protein
LNWPELARELVRSGFDGPMVFEASRPADLDPRQESTKRFEGLIAEAHVSSIEFAKKYGLDSQDDDNDLH